MLVFLVCYGISGIWYAFGMNENIFKKNYQLSKYISIQKRGEQIN